MMEAEVERVQPAITRDVTGTEPAGAEPAKKKNVDGRFIGRRKVKPRVLAVINDLCTGCAGAPVCQIYCPVDECMILVPTEDAFPFGRIWVDPLKCVGCKKCISRGPEDSFLDGCPWDAIILVPTSEWEAEHGELPY
jgi:ferredoxin